MSKIIDPFGAIGDILGNFLRPFPGSVEETFDPSTLDDIVARYVADEDNVEHSGVTLDGTEDYERDAGALITSYPFTISIWFKPDDGQPAGTEVLFSTEGVTFNDNWNIHLRANGVLRLVSRDSGTVEFTDTSNALNNVAETWHHVLAVFHSATDREIYLDGDIANSGTNTIDNTPGSLTQTFIGAFDSGSKKKFAGKIGRIDIWESSETGISRDTLAEALARGDDPLTTSLGTPDHTFFDQTGDTPDGWTANGNPQTHSETYIWRESANVIQAQHSGPVLDGTGDYYTRDAGAIVTEYPLTVSGWIRTPFSGAGTQVVFSVTDGTTNNRFQVSVGDSRKVQAVVQSEIATTTNQYVADTWLHFVVYFVDATNRIVVLNGDWANRGTNTTSATPSSLDTTEFGAIAGGTFELDATCGRLDIWDSVPDSGDRQSIAEKLARGKDPTTVFGLAPTETLFNQTSDTPSGWTANGNPTTHGEHYVQPHHLIGGEGSPDWSSDALSTGFAGLLFDDANSEYMQVNKAIVKIAPFTVFSWAASDDDTVNASVAALADSSTSNSRWWWGLDGGDDHARFNVDAGGGFDAYDTTTTFVVNQLHLITVIEAATDSHTIRLDGAGTGSGSVSRTPSADNLAIGRIGDSTPSGYFSGAVWELIILDDAATTEEEANVESYGSATWGAP